MSEKGLTQIYTGDGKGKTTAAIGLAVRACGRGKRVLFAQFLKGRESGEHRILPTLPGLSFVPIAATTRFLFQMEAAEKEALQRTTRVEWAALCRRIDEGDEDLLILDEAMGALHAGLLEEAELLRFLEERPEKLEVVLTGRSAPQALLKKADLVTEMRPLKHYFDQGVSAREGIEY